MINVNVDYRDLKEDKLLNFTDFLGVDFSHSPLKINPKRSPLMENTISKYGVNHKRPGWKQIAQVGTGHINGICSYTETINNVTKEYFLVYSGTTFYSVELTETGVGYITTALSTANITTGLLQDRRVQFFKQGTDIFVIGCGDYIVFTTYESSPAGTYTLRKVFEWSKTYIPKTSISIDYVGFTPSLRASYEAVNQMTKWKKNGLRGKVGSISEDPVLDVVYHLDSEAYVGENEVKYDNGSNSVPAALVDIEYLNGTEIFEVHLFGYYVYNGTPNVPQYCDLRLTYDGISYGTLYNDGTLTLSGVYTEPPLADDNILVTFMKLPDADYEYTNIAYSQFGTLFGVDGVTSQLFVSGNTSYPNTDFFSYPLDFTYFPDVNYREVGGSAIKGYIRINDGSLGVLKAEESYEASIYFRVGTLSWNSDDSYCETIYSETAGFIGKGVSSPWASAILAGDPLFLGPDKVYGIVLSENVSTDERYARERSKYIDETLKTHTSLAEAISIVFDNKYYLCIDDVCYVADARYRSVESEDMDDTFNYEWWYWTNIPARIFAIFENELYFGTDDGKICIFDDEFTDRTFEEIATGVIVLLPSTDEVAYNSALLTPENNDGIKIDEDTLYECVFKSTDVLRIVANKIYIKITEGTIAYNNMSVLNDGTEVILIPDSQGIPITCYIANSDFGTMSFDLVDINGDAITMPYLFTTFYILRELSGVEVFVAELDSVNHDFKLKRYLNGNVIGFIFYSEGLITDTNDNYNLPAIYTHRDNVVSLWYSSIIDCGTNFESKTLSSITITSEQESQGSVTFGYQTNNVLKNVSALDPDIIGGTNQLDLEGLDFSNFTLSGFATSYTKRVKVRNFNFISFFFESDNDSDCSIDSFVIKFRINKKNRGVR